MRTILKVFVSCLLAANACVANAQPVAITPDSAVIYVGDTIELAVSCPSGFAADAIDWSRSPVLTAKSVRSLGALSRSGRSFLANKPGVVNVSAHCGLYEMPKPVLTATITVLAKGNGKGRFDPAILTIPVGAMGTMWRTCDGGARTEVTNSNPAVARMIFNGMQITFVGLSPGKAGIALMCDTVPAGSAQVTVTPTAAWAAQTAYDRAKSEDGAANAALAAAKATLKSATDTQARAAVDLAAQTAKCRSVPGCVVK